MMPTSTEKLDQIGRVIAQVRDNWRNAVKRGDITSDQYDAVLDALDDVKTRVRKVVRKP